MDIMSKFNLPKYLKGKSFSEASKCIADKFKDRNSPEDIETMNEMQGRLRQAQEFVKAKQEARTKPQVKSGDEQAQHQMPDGSMMAGAEHQEQYMRKGGENPVEKYKKGGEIDNPKPGIGAYTGAATAALSLGKKAFSDTGIDTSGATAAPDVPSQGSSTASGAMEGASAGAAFGPWGAAIGGVVGGVAGLIGGGKANRDAEEARTNFTFGQQNQASNSYKSGGQLLANSFKTGDDVDFQEDNDTRDDIDFQGQNDKDMYDSKEGQPLANRPRVTALEPKGAVIKRLTSDPTNKIVIKSKTEEESTDEDFNPIELLRYAPAAMNMAQLANLKKPEAVALDKLGNKYKEQRVDERGLQNSVQESVNNNRDAILSSSGGSGSAARANLIASQLQGSKAMSSAYQAATGENRQDNVRGQQFDLGVDKTNLGQSNNETNLNLEQQASYQTNKSKLLSQIGNDLGGVGKEELMKRYPELMGMNYNWKGRHKSENKNKKKKTSN